MFIVSITYTKPLDEVDILLEEHKAFLKKHYENGNFLLSGRKVPRSGGIILAKTVSLQEIESIISSDPFYVGGVSRYEIIEFTPSMSVPWLEMLVEK